MAVKCIELLLETSTIYKTDKQIYLQNTRHFISPNCTLVWEDKFPYLCIYVKRKVYYIYEKTYPSWTIKIFLISLQLPVSISTVCHWIWLFSYLTFECMTIKQFLMNCDTVVISYVLQMLIKKPDSNKHPEDITFLNLWKPSFNM